MGLPPSKLSFSQQEDLGQLQWEIKNNVLASTMVEGSPGLSSLITTALMHGSLAALTSSLHITELAISCIQQGFSPDRPENSVCCALCHNRHCPSLV